MSLVESVVSLENKQVWDWPDKSRAIAVEERIMKRNASREKTA
jgi:hypothetical protein